MRNGRRTRPQHTPRIGRQEHEPCAGLKGHYRDEHQPWPRLPWSRAEEGIIVVRPGFRFRRSDRRSARWKAEAFEDRLDCLARMDRGENLHVAVDLGNSRTSIHQRCAPAAPVPPALRPRPGRRVRILLLSPGRPGSGTRSRGTLHAAPRPRRDSSDSAAPRASPARGRPRQCRDRCRTRQAPVTSARRPPRSA